MAFHSVLFCWRSDWFPSCFSVRGMSNIRNYNWERQKMSILQDIGTYILRNA
jgi:hypothetical protein